MCCFLNREQSSGAILAQELPNGVYARWAASLAKPNSLQLCPPIVPTASYVEPIKLAENNMSLDTAP